jgi:hypothetical protein
LGKTDYTEEDRERDKARVRLLSIISLPAGLLFNGPMGPFLPFCKTGLFGTAL